MSEVRLGVGDFVPRILLPGPDGNPRDLSDQAIAGNTLVLWFVHLPLDERRLAALAAELGRFEEQEARVFAVAVGGQAAAACRAIEAGGIEALTDPEARVAPMFGAGDGDRFVVLDPGARIVATVAEPGEARDACARIHASSDPVVAGPTAPVLVLEDVLDAGFCRTLIDMWESGQKVEDNVAATGAQRADAAIKRRSDVFIQDRATYEAFAERVRRRIFPEVSRAFRTRLESFEAPRIGCYEASNTGFFSRHRDNRTKFTAHRLFALTLNLNTGEYEGGDLRFPEFGRQLYRAPAGGAVIFSCALLHEALPVTAGRRFGVFSFLTDAEGARRERELIAAEKAKGNFGIGLS